MTELKNPVPENEMDRLLALAELDLDYSSLNDNFRDLTHLAAKVAGTDISLINLIDSFTQWTIGNYGMDIDQMKREDSVCQYTIMTDEPFEVSNLAADQRFSEKSYVKDPISLRYYLGVPLKDSNGVNLGALCVLDPELKTLSPEKIEMLRIIAGEIVNRLKSYKAIETLRNQVKEADATKKKVAHDIRGPLAGIIGLSEILAQQGKTAQLDEVMEFIQMIHKSSKSVLELADEILSDPASSKLRDSEYNLEVFADKLRKLYDPQAFNKGLRLKITFNESHSKIPFSKNKLLQITGNLISNAIKFTPSVGEVSVNLDLTAQDNKNALSIHVRDTGVGMTREVIDEIMRDGTSTTKGTSGEKGYGFGLALVKHLVENLKGTMKINSTPGSGTSFQVLIPQEIPLPS